MVIPLAEVQEAEPPGGGAGGGTLCRNFRVVRDARPPGSLFGGFGLVLLGSPRAKDEIGRLLGLPGGDDHGAAVVLQDLQLGNDIGSEVVQVCPQSYD